MIRTGISVAWLSDYANTSAERTIPRVWSSLRSSSEWSEWLSRNVDDDYFIVVNFEDREKRKSVVKRDQMSVYVPATEVQAAAEARNLKSFAAELYEDIYSTLADKRGLPAPPRVTEDSLRGVTSRFP